MNGTWIDEDRQALAISRLLDAAGQLFAERGVAGVGMADVSEAAGCSRATLYRYFPNRDALRIAFVRREASRLGAEVASSTQSISNPAKRLEAAVLQSVESVRADPLLAAWFTPDNAGIAADLAAASGVIDSLTQSFLDYSQSGDSASATSTSDSDAARWIVRIVVSLLAMPGRDRREEARVVRELLVPAVLKAAV